MISMMRQLKSGVLIMIEQVYFKIQWWKDAGCWIDYLPTESGSDRIETRSQAMETLEYMDMKFPHMDHRVVMVTEEII